MPHFGGRDWDRYDASASWPSAIALHHGMPPPPSPLDLPVLGCTCKFVWMVARLSVLVPAAKQARSPAQRVSVQDRHLYFSQYLLFTLDGHKIVAERCICSFGCLEPLQEDDSWAEEENQVVRQQLASRDALQLLVIKCLEVAKLATRIVQRAANVGVTMGKQGKRHMVVNAVCPSLSLPGNPVESTDVDMLAHTLAAVEPCPPVLVWHLSRDKHSFRWAALLSLCRRHYRTTSRARFTFLEPFSAVQRSAQANR